MLQLPLLRDKQQLGMLCTLHLAAMLGLDLRGAGPLFLEAWEGRGDGTTHEQYVRPVLCKYGINSSWYWY